MIGGLSFLLIGYGVWNWQFYQALGIPHPLSQAIADWWIGGPNINSFAQRLDPKDVPGADAQQVFAVFFCVFGAVTAGFVHSAGVERMKPVPCYILSAIAGGVMAPVLTYLTYGSASILTNAGLHDCVGVFALYIFVGIWALILAHRLGPRLRRSAAPPNVMAFISGVFLLLVGIPMLVVGSGYLRLEQGYFGISMVGSGLGVIFMNVFVAFAAGTIGGAVIAYRLKTPIYALLGPISGYVACSPLFDIAVIWQVALIALFAPFVTLACGKCVSRMGIDEPKIAALALGPGIYGALAAGIVGAGVPTGGFFDLKTGPYAFQHAHISFAMQCTGVIVVAAISLISGFIFIPLLDKLLGLRVDRATELAGLDASYWSPAPARSDLASSSAQRDA
jgi:ammonia channel protein AmtB